MYILIDIYIYVCIYIFTLNILYIRQYVCSYELMLFLSPLQLLLFAFVVAFFVDLFCCANSLPNTSNGSRSNTLVHISVKAIGDRLKKN